MEDKKTKVEFIERNPRVIFTDLIEIKITEDTVCLNLGVRADNGQKAIVENKVYMTLGHFFRLAQSSGELAKKIQGDLEKLVNPKKNKQ